jgi:hypothetical protein
MLLVGVLAATCIGTAAFAQALKREPPMGALKEGQRVLVDDGSCPPGQIMEVIGGNHVKAGGYKRIERSRRCIPKR